MLMRMHTCIYYIIILVMSLLRTRLAAEDCYYKSTKYQGKHQTTTSGDTCLHWNTVYNTSMTGPGFPDDSVRDAENKCRDPDDKGRPWCYTSPSNWEYCPVAFCEECYYRGKESNFTGYTSRDANNRTCNRWSDYTGPVPLLDSMFPNGSIANASNYCRDPFGIGLLCHTSAGFTPCGIKQCPGQCEDDHTSTNCLLIKDFICPYEHLRRTLCPKTCGDCDVGLLPPSSPTALFG